LRATPPKAVTPIPKPIPQTQVQDCPSKWDSTIWVTNVTSDYVEDIKQTAKVEAVFCTRYVGNSDSDRTPETGVMVEVSEPVADAVLQKLQEVGYEVSLGSMG
jgi:hypothetical protein